MSNLTLRTTFYSLTLALAFCNQAFGIYLCVVDTGYFSPNSWIFSIILTIFCFLTWIWASVLLAFNNRPTSTHALARASSHFYSFLLLTPIHLAIGIMVLSQIHYNCNTILYSDGEPDGCGTGATAGSLSIVQSIIAGLAIWSILRSVTGSPTGLKTNIASEASDNEKSAMLASQA
ncbi:hypothetical protein BDN70DRAFT_872117 [Pholiota conissans]|uniref:Uncharacterized protein n=1 Tax=Pholiota conissans TaxID=109636 RepID=A0A9P5ZCC4_9AGAR|nr:hypothetical protein BDN70DRAFT_872117 [Pholiota conissans]